MAATKESAQAVAVTVTRSVKVTMTGEKVRLAVELYARQLSEDNGQPLSSSLRAASVDIRCGDDWVDGAEVVFSEGV